ncbi:helix-turn-helix domain-containing protein [Acetobacter oryzifermentans]|uniref:helix-turn-helix domain-containing protein n=1 Tax=Acetobacter oryzifermentans TaxID=1633874 RepID=UPI0039BF8E8E
MHIISHSDIESRAKQAGISMRRLCQRAGVAESTMVRWKYKRSSPRLIIIEKISKALADILDERRERGELA